MSSNVVKKTSFIMSNQSYSPDVRPLHRPEQADSDVASSLELDPSPSPPSPSLEPVQTRQQEIDQKTQIERKSNHSLLPLIKEQLNESGPSKKALLLESISKDAIALLVENGLEVTQCSTAYSEEQLLKVIHEYDIVGIRSKTKITKKVLQAAKKLKVVACFCIGTDQVDLSTCSQYGVVVFNSPFPNTRSVAEMVIANIISLSRQIGDRSKECHQGIWNKKSSGCFEIRGKALGIVGYGRVGSQVSILAEMLGMRVFYYNPRTKLPLGNARACKSLPDLLKVAHFVSLHCPSLPSTVNLIGAKEIASMKNGAYLINAARGNCVDVEAVAEALASGKLAGAAFDVFPSEPSGKEEFKSPLQGLKNVILTPHVGGSTEEAQTNIGLDVANKIVNFFLIGSTEGAVELPVLKTQNETSNSPSLNSLMTAKEELLCSALSSPKQTSVMEAFSPQQSKPRFQIIETIEPMEKLTLGGQPEEKPSTKSLKKSSSFSKEKEILKGLKRATSGTRGSDG